MSTDCTNDVADEMYDDAGFHCDTGMHRVTGTEYNPEGYNAEGYNAEGYNAEGYDAEGYNEDGFGENGIHRDSGTVFDPSTRRTCDGDRYDSEGYDYYGIDTDGYDSGGYDSDGYDCDGEDARGYSRCDNGDCDDSDCDRCSNSGRQTLLYSDACVIEETGWHSHRYKRTTPTVAFEFECISHTDADDGARAIRGPFDRSYASLVGNTTNGTGSIAKEDGSLPNDGLEFVTVPMLIDEHRKVLADAFKGGRLGDGRVSAWDKKKCGMHVHVGRSSLSNLTLGKMLCFMHSPGNVQFHVFIASRQSHFAEFAFHRSAVSTGLPSKAGNGDKYSALNVKPYTVEFRIFRPSTRLPTILKNLCYCLAVRDFCRQSSLSSAALTWDRFLLWLGGTDARTTYRELDTWLRQQQDDAGYGTFYRNNAKPCPKPKPEA